MKFLLFFTSIIFSLIFYIFYGLSKWKDIFWDKISNSVNLISISGNLLIETFIYLLIWILFLYLFSNFKNKSESTILNYKYEILYFMYYIIYIYILLFINNNIDYILLLWIIIFILSDILFNHLSNLKFFLKNKIEIRIIWLILNYFSSFMLLFLLFNNNIEILTILMLIYNIVFNFLVHKKYTNYISLLISILIIGFLFYILYFWLFELYILYI